MEILNKAKKIIVKVGSSHIVDIESGEIKLNWLNNLVKDIATLHRQGKKVIIVTGGAVAVGCNMLKLNHGRAKLHDKQAAFGMGQIEIINAYKNAFQQYNILISQLLMTIEDFENRKHFLSAKKVLECNAEHNVISVINENDLITTAEIRFGDNDRLSARIANMTESDCLILLANVDGVYSQDPSLNKSARFIKEIYEVNVDIEKMATDSVPGTGGMSAKVSAAKMAMKTGCDVILTYGLSQSPINQIISNNQKYTLFLPKAESNLKYYSE